MPKKVRVLSDGSTTREGINLKAVHQVDDPDSVERRRDEAVERMRQARAEIEAEVAGLTGLQAFRGDVWSIAHVLAHLDGNSGGHLMPAREIVEAGATELEPFSRDGAFREALAAVLADIDDCIRFSDALTREQLLMHARKGNREHYVVGIIEVSAEHFLEHADQIRQIKSRLGYPLARAQDQPAAFMAIGETAADDHHRVTDRDVAASSGMETDPVCAMEVDPGSAAGSSTYEGRTYYFCSGACQRQFDRDPGRFLGVGSP